MATATMQKSTQLYEDCGDGRLRLHFHPGQQRAWDSDRRIVAIFAGTQGG